MKTPFDKYQKVPTAKVNRLLSMAPASAAPDSLRTELSELDVEIRRLRKLLAQPLPGKLVVSGTDTKPKYYLEGEHGKRYLTREELDLAAAHAQEDYYRVLLGVLEERYAKLSEALRCLEDLDPRLAFENLPGKRQALVVPEYLSDGEFAELWLAAHARYAEKGFREGDRVHYSARGERVRSKSESDVADRCYYRKVPYLYEYPWTLSSSGVWFPDFTVVNVRTRKVYLWEHLGMEDDPDYAVRNLEKLRIYQENGFWPGENLILTHEDKDHPLTVRDIDAVIDHYLL